MIRVFILVAGPFMVTVSYAETMECDEERKCSPTCYYLSDSTRTEHVYPANGASVAGVLVEATGADNILYTSQRIDRSGTMPSYHHIESFILPNNYPRRLSPVQHDEQLATVGGGVSSARSMGKRAS